MTQIDVMQQPCKTTISIGELQKTEILKNFIIRIMET